MMTPFVPADRVTRIKASPSTAAAARVRQLKDEGHQITDLTVGEPDFDTPQHIKEAAIAAINAGDTKYTPVNGTPALRAAIRGRLSRVIDCTYADTEITVGGGAKQVIFLALMATLNQGDEVLIPAPYWVSYPDMVLANDGAPVVLPCTQDVGFKLQPEQLRSAITDRTKWLILNAPSNPTGASYSHSEYQALAAVLDEFPGVSVLTDEIYDEISFTDGDPTNLVRSAPELRERVFIVNGVSKTYAMTGWRIGYGVGNQQLVASINKLQSQMSSCPSSISQAAAAVALSGDQSFVAESVAVYRSRRDRAAELLNDIDGIDVVVPDGAFYLYVRCGGAIGKTAPDGRRIENDQDFTLYLLEVARVAVIQGSAYGLSPYFRMSFATSLDIIEEGCAAIAAAMRALR